MQAAIEGGAEVLLTIYLLSLFLISSFLDGKIKYRHFACFNSLINLCHSYLTVEEKNKYIIVCSNFKRELLRTYYKRADTDELDQKKYGDLLRNVFINRVIILAFPSKYGVHLPYVPVEHLYVLTVTITSLNISVLKTHRQLDLLSEYRDEIGEGQKHNDELIYVSLAIVFICIDELIDAMRFTLKLAETVASHYGAVKVKFVFEKISYNLNNNVLGYGSTHPEHIADYTQSVEKAVRTQILAQKKNMFMERTEHEDLDAISQNAEDADNDLNITARLKQMECGPSQQTGPPPNVRRHIIDTKCETTTKRDSVRSYIPMANINEKLREIQLSHEQNRLSTRIPAYEIPRTKPDLLPGYDWLIARFIPRDTRPHRPSTPPLNPNASLALTGERLRQRMSQRNYRIASMVHLPGVRLLDMSAAGLYLDEDEDVFRCFRCSFAVPRSRWPEEENPWEVHRRMSPDCPLVNADAQHAEGRQLRSSEEGREGVDATRDHNTAQDLEEVGEEEGAPGDCDNPAEDSGYGPSLVGPPADASVGCPPSHKTHRG